MTEAGLSKEKEKPVTVMAESKASGETIVRFRDFVKDRATAVKDKESAEKIGAFNIGGSMISDIAPVTSSIIYTYREYEGEDGGPVGQEEDADLSIKVGLHEVFGLFISAARETEPKDIVDGEGESLGDDTDNIVNGVLDQIEELETNGVITPAPIEYPGQAE